MSEISVGNIHRDTTRLAHKIEVAEKIFPFPLERLAVFDGCQAEELYDAANRATRTIDGTRFSVYRTREGILVPSFEGEHEVKIGTNIQAFPKRTIPGIPGLVTVALHSRSTEYVHTQMSLSVDISHRKQSKELRFIARSQFETHEPLTLEPGSGYKLVEATVIEFDHPNQEMPPYHLETTLAKQSYLDESGKDWEAAREFIEVRLDDVREGNDSLGYYAVRYRQDEHRAVILSVPLGILEDPGIVQKELRSLNLPPYSDDLYFLLRQNILNYESPLDPSYLIAQHRPFSTRKN